MQYQSRRETMPSTGPLETRGPGPEELQPYGNQAAIEA